jgi:hypothetical protein
VTLVLFGMPELHSSAMLQLQDSVVTVLCGLHELWRDVFCPVGTGAASLLLWTSGGLCAATSWRCWPFMLTTSCWLSTADQTVRLDNPTTVRQWGGGFTSGYCYR